MGLWLNEPLISRPEEIDVTVNALADAGYGVVRIFVRNTNYTHRSPEVIAAVDRAARVARGRGLLSALDCEPHATIGGDMVREFPDAMGMKLVRHAVKVVDGHWIIRAVQPPLAHGLVTYIEGVEAAFLSVAGVIRPIELNYSDSRCTLWNQNGNIHRELVYIEGMPLQPRRVDELRGQLPGVGRGELIVFLRYAALNFTDFWADGFRAYYDDLIERYRGVPLDGIGWDEPAVDGNWDSYRYGSAFAAAFRRLNGYELRDRLYLLDAPGMPAESVRVRLDYYRTLNEGLAQAQANCIAKARAVFGQDILLGTHHTWQGESGITDYRTGAVDYFRLNDNMDAGYTDSPQWDAPVVAYAYTLASSLGRLTPSGEAEVNTWHFRVTVANLRRNVALMSLMNITWFNIWFGRDDDCIMQQGHYAWPETVAAMHRHQQVQRMIGTRRPVVDVAIWHGWEGACGLNSAPIANAQKSFWLNTCQLFIERSIAADFIDSRLLAESEVEDGRLVNALGRYRVLIMPYAVALPRRAFDACVAFARAGGRVVFVGAPVAADEQGNSLCDAFAALVGMPPMTAEHYFDGLDAVCTLDNMRRQRLEVCRPLPADLPRGLVSCEGEPHGVVSADGNVVFLTDLDPQQRLIDRIADVLPREVRAFGDNLIWRLYRGNGDDLLVVATRDDRPLSGEVRWKGRTIELTGGMVGVLSHAGDKLEIRGDATGRPAESDAR
jgi:hypothetical protein